MVADASSKLRLIECGTTSREHCKEDLFKELEQAYKKEKETNEILENLDAHKEFCVVQNKIYYIKNGRIQLYLP